MSGLFRTPSTGFVAQAFKTIILNQQRHFSFMPTRRYTGLLAVGSQSLQSRQPKPVFFTPVVQKAPIAQQTWEIIMQQLINLYLYTIETRHQEQKKVHPMQEITRQIIKSVEEEMRIFRREAPDVELASYVNHLIDTLEPHYQAPVPLRESMRYYDRKDDILWSSQKLDEMIMGLENTKGIIDDPDCFNLTFLDIMHQSASWPKFLNPLPGSSLLGDMQFYLKNIKIIP